MAPRKKPLPLTLKELKVLEFIEQFMLAKGVAPSYQEIRENFGFASFNSVQRYLKQLQDKNYLYIPGGNQKRAMQILHASTSISNLLSDRISDSGASVPTTPSPVLSQTFKDSGRQPHLAAQSSTRQPHLAAQSSTRQPHLAAQSSARQSHLAGSYSKNQEPHLDEMPPRTSPRMGPLPLRAEESLSLPLLGRVAAGAPIEAFTHDEHISVPAGLIRNPSKTFALVVQGQSMIEDGIFDGDVIFVQKQTYANNGETVVAMVNNQATVKRFYLHSGKADIHSDPQTTPHSKGERQIELRPANSTMQSMWYPPYAVDIQGIVVGLIRRF